MCCSQAPKHQILEAEVEETIFQGGVEVEIMTFQVEVEVELEVELEVFLSFSVFSLKVCADEALLALAVDPSPLVVCLRSNIQTLDPDVGRLDHHRAV